MAAFDVIGSVKTANQNMGGGAFEILFNSARAERHISYEWAASGQNHEKVRWIFSEFDSLGVKNIFFSTKNVP